MAKKPKRGAPAIDMTAMVDVAFLLLTFFILTTTSFREEAKVEVDMPSSISKTEIPATKLCTISISNEGKVFVGYSDIATREAVLKRFAAEKFEEGSGDGFTEEGARYFSTLQDFGVPHEKFKAWLNGETEFSLGDFPHDGISPEVTDSTAMTGNDLKDWIRWGRMADQRMRFAIKGDMEADYPVVENVISSLQDWDVNQFSLITTMEDGGLVEAE
ncbi:biopolymer transporter ExbD [Pontibacter sp. G13]|uniref:ExbD/TolR family protein n=1 Tax=Pontibacter sp. G13 TaxID=3074898 RepID=UPI00288BF42C|nr:biopolymer transporter ExbD [Pontibacter sp. G13]WNJ16701.1 biopolymer transporter ExbD [Pontibacter sp. G13]